ncbi:PREDICTED: tumor necrosis factor receptor superfamily member 5 isoform X4 [Myotis davidii]|uniref:tumor necrosis factor receptor superfamily member 5 isoform X4 n=1 Tax=Myotis davidii TaxID=225400 RepID=UPI0007675091|nr:PREDICTED: tumor necrosis factor receptor superfamily member 5 isoform X4 [Myotis davidii]
MVRLPLQCLLLGCWFAAVHPEPPACSEKQYPTESQCCNLCPPGQKLVSDCTAVTDTECVPCSEGEFLGTWSNERRCHPHRYCDPNLKLRVQSKGTLKTDTTCTCDEGRHCVDEVCENCAPHSSCPPGFGVKEIATGVSDTICEPCLVGFFSNVSSAYDKCHPWTSCEIKGLVELRAGTNKTDAVCGKLPKVNCKTFRPEDPGKAKEEARRGPTEVEDSTAPVQETLHWYQPVVQEDGKESRISVQERQ